MKSTKEKEDLVTAILIFIGSVGLFFTIPEIPEIAEIPPR